MSFDSHLLDEILVCTKCRGALVRDDARLVCTVPDCRMKFEIRDQIPNMLLEEAAKLEKEEWGAAMRQCGRDPSTGTRIVPK